MYMNNTGLDFVKGVVIEALLTYSRPISANVTFDVPDGRVMHVNADSELETGAQGFVMPLFLVRAGGALDVVNDGGDDYEAVLPSGVTTAIVATCGMELASAQFDADQTYYPNDKLRGIKANSTEATGGLLTNQTITLGTNTICGVVSRGVQRNAQTRRDMLYFWPVFIPGSEAV